MLEEILEEILKNMVFVKGGTLMMGCTPEQGTDFKYEEKPAHQVTVSDFYIGKYLVTQKQWRELTNNKAKYLTTCDNCPVELQSWVDIQKKFIAKLNKKTGMNYRLPTEAEWEYAARGGSLSQGYKYSGSNILNQVAWYSENSRNRAHPVGQKKPNELGLYDMSGNVWEWCADEIEDETFYGTSLRVCRGGSWQSKKLGCLIASRICYVPWSIGDGEGFRLAL